MRKSGRRHPTLPRDLQHGSLGQTATKSRWRHDEAKTFLEEVQKEAAQKLAAALDLGLATERGGHGWGLPNRCIASVGATT